MLITPRRLTLQQRRQEAFDTLLANYYFGDGITITGEGFLLQRHHHQWHATLCANTPTGPRSLSFFVKFRRHMADAFSVSATDMVTHRAIGYPTQQKPIALPDSEEDLVAILNDIHPEWSNLEGYLRLTEALTGKRLRTR